MLALPCGVTFMSIHKTILPAAATVKKQLFGPIQIIDDVYGKLTRPISTEVKILPQDPVVPGKLTPIDSLNLRPQTQNELSVLLIIS